MRTTGWITLYAGLIIGCGYGFGTLVRSRWSATALPSVSDHQASGLPRGLKTTAIEAAAALLWAVFAYRFIDWVAPGTSQFREFSAVGILSPRALTIWEAVSLWAGLAVVVGLVVPFDRGFRPGSNGLGAAAGLLLVFSPFTFFLALFAWFGAQWRFGHWHANLVALSTAVVIEWLLSMLSSSLTPQAWGFVHGPESTLWVTALAGSLAARQSHEPRA